MISPPALRSGDTIGIVATARKISEKELRPAIKMFQNWGLNVITGKNMFGHLDQFSGTDEERTADLQSMLDDRNINAVVFARGGYGTVRIIDRIDFGKFQKHPKWLAGFSDITVIHAHVQQNLGIETLHSMMPVNIVNGKKMIFRAGALESMRKALFGEKLSYRADAHPLNREGRAMGEIVGGNLSVLYSLSGSVSDIDTTGKIFFLEDLDEYLYHIDRMMVNLDRAGKFNKIKGLVIGGMSEVRDNKIPFGKTAEQIVSDIVKKYKFPVCFGFPAGHVDDNRALILGRPAELIISKTVAKLVYK
jgi:muramoyltetrapeptide carboxypeptidase